LHHITGDGWSMDVLMRELSILYGAFSAAEPSPLPPLTIQYPDFAAWQRQWLQSDVLDRQIEYWRRQLEGSALATELFTDQPRPPVRSFRGQRQCLALHGPLTAALRILSRKEDVTLFMTLLAAFQVLLHRYTGQDEVTVGTPIAGRNWPAV